jgi:D-arabinono-1,4-lactone oxidase
VEAITLVLADGTITTCSLENDPDMFRAALVSLGSLGVVIRVTMRASQQYQLSYTTETISLSRFLKEYSQIWRSAEYVRAWWWPYSQKVVVWRGDRTQAPQTSIKAHSKWLPNFEIGKRVYEASLYALTYYPSLLPSFERALFRSQFPAKENVVSGATVANPHEALQMDCLFSQYVDEWAVSLDDGVEAIRRLDNWINKDDDSSTGIPVKKGKRTFVHAPIEIRVNAGIGDQAYLSPSRDGTAVIYIGVIMFRPYFTPVSYRAYFHAYEHLMRSLGGKPHWAKQHNVNAEEEKRIFGEGMERWLEIRRRVDPTGVFVNGYVKRHLMGEKEGKESKGVGTMDGESGRLYKRFRAVL